MSTEQKHEALVVHIRGLEMTLAKRNETIQRLEKRLSEPSSDIERARKSGYRDGWKACAAYLMETTRKAAIDLAKVRKDAFDAYLYGEAK